MFTIKVNSDLESDEIYCKSVAKSLSEILRFSLDEEFRNQVFDLIEVKSSKETEKALNKRLLSIIKDKRISGKKFKKQKSKLKVIKSSTNVNDEQSKSPKAAGASTSQGTRSNSNIQTSLGNFPKRNWLKISSEKYKETLKNKQIGHSSQPLFCQTQTDTVDTLLYSFSAPYYTTFQMSSELSSHYSLSQKYSSSSLEPSDEGFYKENFTEFFQHNF